MLACFQRPAFKVVAASMSEAGDRDENADITCDWRCDKCIQDGIWQHVTWHGSTLVCWPAVKVVAASVSEANRMHT
jgi:hypothetical protein